MKQKKMLEDAGLHQLKPAGDYLVTISKKKSHVVQRLKVHLPGNYLMQNISQAQEDLVDIGTTRLNFGIVF